MSLTEIVPSFDARIPVLMCGNPYEVKLPYSLPESIVEGYPAGKVRTGPATDPANLTKLFDFDFERDPASGFILLDLTEILPYLPSIEVIFPNPELLAVVTLESVRQLNIALEWIIDAEREDNLIMSQENICVIGAGTAGRLAARYGQDYLVTAFAEIMPFLTHQPADKPILPEQPEFLYYLHNFEFNEGLTLAVKYFDESGTGTMLDSHTIEAEPYGVYCIPCGPSQLQLPSSAVTYEIALIDAAGRRKTHVRTYYIDRTPYVNATIVVFQNSFGVYDVLSLVGDRSTKATFESESEQLMKAPFNQSQIHTQRREQTDQTTFKTGHYPPGWFPYFSELLRSKKVAVLDDGVYYFAKVATNEAELENTFEPQYSLDITLSSEVANSYYSL